MQRLNDWKEENLITPADCIAYGQSRHVQDIIKLIEDIGEGTILANDIKKNEVQRIRFC